MIPPDPLKKVPTSRVNHADECSQCGRRLRERATCWAHGDGMLYCTRRCAEAHAVYQRYVQQRGEP